MRQFAFGLSVATLALLASCTGGAQSPASTTVPAQLPTTQSTAGLGAPMINGDLVQTASALYRLRIDPATLSATLTLAESRAAQKNDDIYDLSVDAFFGAGTIEVADINGSGTSVDVTFNVRHPFNAPTNLAGPATAGNRADLGVSTRLLFIAEAPGSAPTYFAGAGDVVANTDLMPKADGLMDPGGMITDPGTTATAFPFIAVIDELADNRDGVSNSGSVTGNFDPTNGWTQATMGTGNNGWTGYGVLHQGQSARVNASFDVDALGALGGFELNVIPIVKYNDPRVGANAATKRANRLPPATPDATKFGYRMPHGAMDIENVRFEGETGGLVANTITATDINFYVVDWDARATETTEASLADDLTLSNVAIGESGAPTFEVEIPGVISSAATLTLTDDDSAIGGDAGVDSGVPGDALYYTANITNTGNSQPVNGGPVVGLAKVTDIEAGATFNDTWRFALDPTLAPLAASIPEPIVYQAFEVELAPDNDPPTYTSVTVPSVAGNGASIAIGINGIADPQNEALTIEIDWDDDGTYTDEGVINSPYPNPANRTSPITYTYSGPGVDTRNLPMRLTDGINVVDITPTPTFTVDSCPGGTVSNTAYAGPLFIWSANSSLTPLNADFTTLANNQVFADFAPLRFGFSSPNRGVVYHQLKLGGTPASDFQKVQSDTGTSALITNFGANMLGKQVHQIEVDSTNRVLFARKNTDTTANGPANTVYASPSGAEANIYYFDYSGAVVPFASVVTINTGTNRVVAMTLDNNDNVLMIDATNVLHRYLKASSYAEDTASPFPIDLKLPPFNMDPVVVGTANEKVHDLVFDNFTQTTYILSQTQETASGTGNGYLYRLDCNWTLPATVAGNPNPKRFVLSDNTTQSTGCDITIDQLDPSGASINGSRQILTIGNTSSSAVPDVICHNTNLATIGTADVPGFKAFKGCISVENLPIYAWNGGGYLFFRSFNPPSGWQ